MAAYPVHGPLDVIGKAPVGVLEEDLRSAAMRALAIPRGACRAFALGFSWRRSAEEFLANLEPIASAGRASSAESVADGRRPEAPPVGTADPERG